MKMSDFWPKSKAIAIIYYYRLAYRLTHALYFRGHAGQFEFCVVSLGTHDDLYRDITSGDEDGIIAATHFAFAF